MPSIFHIRLLVASVVAPLAALAGLGACDSDDVCRDQGTMLLQTTLHLEASSRQALSASSNKLADAVQSPETPALVEQVKPEISLLATNATETSSSSMRPRPVDCDAFFMPVELQLGYETLRSLGYISDRSRCRPAKVQLSMFQHASGGHKRQAMSAVGVAPLRIGDKRIGVEDPEAVDLLSLPPILYFLGFCGLVCVLVISSLFRTVMVKPSAFSEPLLEKGKGESVYRPEGDAWKRGFFSWLSISWATPWITRWGAISDCKVKASELGEAGDPDDEASRSFVNFDRIWKADLEARGDEHCNLYRVLFNFSTWQKTAIVAMSTAGYNALQYLGPTFAVEWLLNFIAWMAEEKMKEGTDQVPLEDADLLLPTIVTVLLFAGIPMSMAFCNTITYLVNVRLNIRMQSALVAAVYRKAHRLPAICSYDLSDTSQKEVNEEQLAKAGGASAEKRGEQKYNLTQLVNRDISGFLIGLQENVSKMIALIPILFVLLFLLSFKLKSGTIAPLLSMAIIWTLAGACIKRYLLRLRWSQEVGADRQNFFQEVMFGIRVMKSYAWEDAGLANLEGLRRKELRHVWWFFFWTGGMVSLLMFFPRLVIMSSLSGYVYLFGHDIKVTDLFVMIQLLHAFKGCSQAVLTIVPALYALGPSIRRIDLFLKLPEANLPADRQQCKQPWISVWPARNKPEADTSGQMRVQGTFAWQANGAIALHEVNVSVKPGELVAVVGAVGSGKTALLHAMMGELVPAGDGRIEVAAKTAYHSQVPFISEATLKENIIFWSDYDEKRYNEAIVAACLSNDLRILPGGDAVPIGNRGIALSGGQRARVSLARAAYAMDADAVLIDDPFSSVDAHTGQHIMHQLLLGPLMNKRTRIVVCQPDYERIKAFDRVIVLDGGRIVVQGTPSEVTQLEEYRSLLGSVTQNGDSSTYEASGNKPSAVSAPEEESEAARQLRDEEYEGRAEWETVRYFCVLGRWKYLLVCNILILVTVIFNLLGDVSLANWANELTYIDEKGVKPQVASAWTYVGGYAFWVTIGLVTFVAGYLSGISWSINVSIGLHECIVRRLLRAPIDRFYDKTPVGRIMNRMSNDLGHVDYHLFLKIIGSCTQVWWFGVPMAYVHIAMPVYFSIGSIPFYVLLWMIFTRYWNTVVPLRYLSNTTRSKLNMFMTEAESGALTVRAYQVGDSQSLVQMAAADALMRADFAGSSTKRWVVNRFILLFSLFATSIALMGVLLPNEVDLGSVSLCITNVIIIINGMEWYIDQLTQIQYEFIALNRLHEYTQIVQERAEELPSDRRYQSLTVKIRRSALKGLQCLEDTPSGFQVVRPQEAPSTCAPCRVCLSRQNPKAGTETQPQHDVILMQTEDGKGFVAAEDKASSFVATLAELDPSCASLQGLDRWHRLVGANSAFKDAQRIAEEMCHGLSEDVQLTIESGWLQDGARIEIKDLVAGYADFPTDVLKGVNLVIDKKTKVAVCGTTGCGKSTLMQCLLRMLEPRGGSIKINGVDLQSVGLKTLRRTVGFVPQDAIVFSGTVRSNLDPFDEYKDERIWQALRSVQLESFVEKSGAGLLMTVKADGENMSFGQRQLLCIARMILRQPSLLLLDEATSGIDPATQELVNNTIKEQFPSSTILAVAHRLETVLDFDVVVVMERGRVVETGSVQELADLKGGYFANLLAKAGLAGKAKTGKKDAHR
eukprot:TRINITY_DN26835_c0_g2_i1.p1 TRINITY_DN26835_c0_g2~~TRINITY_DN26835_c0_g2_i1.p1  ORF type:complete len:1687 (+),score=385.59 TRINITY_DN26835_c0_g2_i1:83-5143(+)